VMYRELTVGSAFGSSGNQTCGARHNKHTGHRPTTLSTMGQVRPYLQATYNRFLSKPDRFSEYSMCSQPAFQSKARYVHRTPLVDISIVLSDEAERFTQFGVTYSVSTVIVSG
jgi:hypothetical protein